MGENMTNTAGMGGLRHLRERARALGKATEALGERVHDLEGYIDSQQEELEQEIEASAREARLGAFVDVWRSYGFGFDEATGLFSANGIGDITEAQARAIVAAGRMTNDNRNTLYQGMNIRTHLPAQVHFGVTSGDRTFHNSAVEIVAISLFTPASNCFTNCRKLRSISIYNQGNYGNDTFLGCTALESLSFYGNTQANRGINLRDSPLISLASLEMIVNKTQASQNTSGFTLTVHPSVYAKMTATDRDDGWTRLPALAAAKNITIATTE